MDGISCSCQNKLQPPTSDWGAFPPSWLTWLHTSLWLTGICLLPPSHLPPPCWLHAATNLSHGLYPCLCPMLPCLAPLPWMLLQDQKKNYKAVQSCEEGGSGGAYLEPLVALAQNGANMHNVLGPACIFLRKGFAESRQAVRKSRQCHVHACRAISTRHKNKHNNRNVWWMRVASHCNICTYSMWTSVVELGRWYF